MSMDPTAQLRWRLLAPSTPRRRGSRKGAHGKRRSLASPLSPGYSSVPDRATLISSGPRRSAPMRRVAADAGSSRSAAAAPKSQARAPGGPVTTEGRWRLPSWTDVSGGGAGDRADGPDDGILERWLGHDHMAGSARMAASSSSSSRSSASRPPGSQSTR